MTISLTKYTLPNGAKSFFAATNMPDDLQPIVSTIELNGCKFTCEILTTGEWSITISHEEGDFDCEICSQSCEQFNQALERLIRRWNIDDFESWLMEVS